MKEDDCKEKELAYLRGNQRIRWLRACGEIFDILCELQSPSVLENTQTEREQVMALVSKLRKEPMS